MALVDFGSEDFFKAGIASPTHLGPVELVSENKSVNTAVVQTETAAAGDLVLGAGEAGEPPGAPPGWEGSPPRAAGTAKGAPLSAGVIGPHW